MTAPSQATLAVVLSVRDDVLQLLLWQRARDPFLGAWSLPGGLLEPGETLETSIRRHLAVKVDVREVAHLEQLTTLSDPDRVPGSWQLATAYLGLVPTTLAYVLFGRGLTVLTPGTVATLNLAEPVVATLLGVLVLDERLAVAGVVGMVLVVAGLALLARSSARAPAGTLQAGQSPA